MERKLAANYFDNGPHFSHLSRRICQGDIFFVIYDNRRKYFGFGLLVGQKRQSEGGL